ncbi:MAG: SGNH/GDSL hydrolase family protein [Chitinophagales bacterium]
MKTIVCLGDSITYGYPYGPQISWTHRLAEATGYNIINRGINGNTTSDMLSRFDRHVIAFHPDYVIIMGGINDIIWRESHDRIVWNIEQMIKKAQNAGISVVIGMVTPIDDSEGEARLTRLREWLTEFTREQSIPVIDFYSVFINREGQLINELLLDGGHPTTEGYHRMFEAIPTTLFRDNE